MCLELEAPKPRRLMAKFPGTAATLSDASRLPVRTGSVENVLTIAVPHHLGNPAWELMLSETHRVLKPGGYLFLLEPLSTARWAGRMLWGLDRGSYPRTKEALLAILRRVPG